MPDEERFFIHLLICPKCLTDVHTGFSKVTDTKATQDVIVRRASELGRHGIVLYIAMIAELPQLGLDCLDRAHTIVQAAQLLGSSQMQMVEANGHLLRTLQ